MRQSLTWKLIGAFLLVAVIGLTVTIVLARWLIIREFNQFINGQLQAQFVSTAADYYRAHGSWQGIREGTRRNDLADSRPAASPQSDPQPSYVFLLADQNGIVLIPAGKYQIGDSVSPGDLSHGISIEVDGLVVGTALPTGAPVSLTTREEYFMAATYRVLLYATVIAAFFALLVGIVLSVSLTQPLRELTTLIRHMTPDNLGHQVKIRSRDELGELAVAFNHLSADLAKSNQLRRQMTADIAHELRSPLQIVAGYIESMQDGVLEPTQERLGVIGAEVELVNHLVTDLRTLTLADTDALALNWQTLTLQTLIQRVVNVYSDQAQRGGVNLEAVRPERIASIRGDEERLVQVLSNLVSNALRYTPPQGTIRITAAQANGQVTIRVQDTGQGISAADLPFIFERFYRADKSRKSDRGESGLGLAIAKAIVGAHGGSITASSPGIGCGATFEILFPASR